MPTNHDDTLLIFRIDCIPCAVVAGSVQSIVMPPEHLTQPPGSDRGHPGIFRHAGQIYAVVDLRQRFGIDTPRQGAGRLLLHENGSRRHALWVDQVVGLVRSEEGQWATLPPYLPRSLFYSGFLYQQEIILCSTLDALLAMHDAEPIRRHLEQLCRAAKKEESAAPEKPAAAPPAANTHPAPAESRESTAPPAQTARLLNPPNTASANVRPPSRPVPVPRPATTARPSKPKAASTQSTITRAPHRALPTTTPPPVGSRGSPHPADGVHHATPPATTARDNNDSRGLVWLLVALLLTGGATIGLYPLLKEPEKVVTTADYSNPPPPYTRPQEVPATPVITAATSLSAPPAAAAPAQITAADAGTAAVQIDRDAEGTITMIIQRARLHANGDETTGSITRQPVVEGEAPNSSPPSDSDWPAPEALPEPCDCTHIVVRGDTLWDIAQHYTNNAFNYPELARQSGIRNPHRIYPGNKVRIIVR